MKKIVCEMCEGMEFVKENGMFVCQECGMKYSLEEAKMLMREVNSEEGKNIPVKKNPTNAIVEQKPVVVEGEAKDERSEELQRDEDDIDQKDEEIDENEVEKPASKEPLEKKKEKPDVLFFIALGICVLFFFISIKACTGAVAPENIDSSANLALLAIGAIQIIAGLIIYKITNDRRKKICPNCGEARIHHREYLHTTEQYKKGSTSTGFTGETLAYTHHYHDSYICPNCGETFEEDVKESGGEIVEDAMGTHDRRRPPKEF